MAQGERNLWERDRVDAHLLFDVAELGRFCAQEFAPRGHVVEQRAHFDLRAGCLAAIVDVAELAAIDVDLGAADRIGFAGREPEPRDAGDRRQGLAAEPERGDPGEVFLRVEFAGGVALEAK